MRSYLLPVSVSLHHLHISYSNHVNDVQINKKALSRDKLQQHKTDAMKEVNDINNAIFTIQRVALQSRPTLSVECSAFQHTISGKHN